MEKNIFLKIKNRLLPFTLPLVIMALAASLMYLLAACTTQDTSSAAVGTAMAGIAGLAGIYICFIVVAWAVGIFFFVMWVISLVDCAKRENMDFPSPADNSKVLWILIIVLAGGVGAIIYYFVVMKNMPRKKIT